MQQVLCIYGNKEDALLRENLALFLRQTFVGLLRTKGTQLTAAQLWDYLSEAIRPSESFFGSI